jgi:hypothetical protein
VVGGVDFEAAAERSGGGRPPAGAGEGAAEGEALACRVAGGDPGSGGEGAVGPPGVTGGSEHQPESDLGRDISRGLPDRVAQHRDGLPGPAHPPVIVGRRDR